MLRKDLLRVSRAGGGYRPKFVDESDRQLASTSIERFRDHVGEPRSRLTESLEKLEREASDFKLVRGLASLLEREAAFETVTPVPPERVRRVTFEASAEIGVARDPDRDKALARAADQLGTTAAEIESALYADRDQNQIMTAFESRWDADTLLTQYNLSLAQTALFDATEIELSSTDPRAIVSAVKRLGLMYEIRVTDSGRIIDVTGPDSLFRRTRRYGTGFARVLRTVAATAEWHLEAQIDDGGTTRTLRLDQTDVSVPGVDPVADPSYDSGVESDFAARFERLDLDWSLTREPEPLRTGHRVMIPDFAFDYAFGEFRVFFEIMGFWTPEYVSKKLSQLAELEDVDMIVAVDQSLGVGEEIQARDQRATEYSGTVSIKAIASMLRDYEQNLTEAAAAAIPERLTPDEDVCRLESLATEYGVSEDVLKDKRFPDHRRLGQTLVRPAVLDRLESAIEPGMALTEADTLLSDRGIEESSAVLSAMGYRVDWEGLGGGTIRPKESGK